jgi:uncharacterized repeat protein (TIGR03803 family)
MEGNMSSRKNFSRRRKHRRGVDHAAECYNLKVRRWLACADSHYFTAEALERRILLSGYTITTLGSPTGAYPEASLVLDGSTLYGTASYYGDNASAIFSEPTSGGTPTLLTVLNDTGGDDPNGVTLSGKTLYYGYNNEVCSLPVTGGTPTVLESLYGAGPGDLTVSGSTLYGSDGNVFSVPISGGTPTVLSSTISSWGALVVSGNTLYGANGGEVFSLPTSGGTPTILASFSGDPGPMGGLILSGNTLYGTTEFGGPSGTLFPIFATGEVYSVPVTGGTPTVLASFSGTDGAEPLAGLILSGNTFYGTTFAGGNMSLSTDGADAFPGAGTVFSLPIAGGTPTVLVAFDDTDGNGPAASLIADAAGNLYGTTEYGGPGPLGGSGTIFELIPNVGAPQLAFTQQPTNALAGVTISPSITVAVEGSNGNVLNTDNSTVTLSIGSGPAGTLSGGIVTATAVNGVATFSYEMLPTPGTYMLQATDGSDIAATSSSITVSNPSGLSTIEGAQYSITGWPGAQTLDVTAGTAVLNADFSADFRNYTLKVENGARVVLASDQTVGNLDLISGGTLDIGNNGLIIFYGFSDPVSTIAGYVASGYDGGSWTGPGIDSSAAALSKGAYGVGFADGADGVVQGLYKYQIEVEYTLNGDANLDGVVNAADFSILAANFNQSVTGWDQGDFNYDGLVNAADFTDLAANFNQSANLNAPGLVAGSGAIYSITGSPGAQMLDILSGMVTLTSDLSALLPNYSLQIESGASVVLASDQHIGALQLLGSGSLDVNNYTMFINYGLNPDPISTIAGYIKSCYNSGGWNGQGITSTAAQTPTNGLYYGLGYADGNDGVVSGLSSGQIEIKYTLLGDANLDGLVNGSDFNILAANFNQSITGWDQGDFNYDGLANAADFNELAANFNQGASGASVASSGVVLDTPAAPAIAVTVSAVTTSTIESTANTTATPAAAATAPKVTTSTTSAARNMTAAPAVISAPLTVATVTTRSTAAAPPASKSKPVGVSKAVIANGKSKGSVMTNYAASVVTVPTSGSMATPQNTNDKDAKFLAAR